MFSSSLIDLFVHDKLVVTLAVLLLLDFVLGVCAAFVLGTFRLSYVSDFLRNDVLGKLLPYYALWAALHIGGADFDLFGLNAIDSAAGLLIGAAFAASILNSLRDLGLGGLGDTIAGPDPNSKV